MLQSSDLCLVLSSVCLVLSSALLVEAKLNQLRAKQVVPSRDIEEIIGITLQDRAAQEVGDKCFQNIGPCDADLRYRTFDGSCNNLIFPMWGLSESAAIRARPANYSDGRTLPRRAVSGEPLPNSRTLRTELIPEQTKEDRSVWLLFQGWGQFISHDTGHSTPKAKDVRCCTPNGKIIDPFSNVCMPILVPRNDSFYSTFQVECLDMFRAKTLKELGCFVTDLDCQIVDVTHFIDASNVYGSNQAVAYSLREFDGGLLRVQEYQGEIFPPNVEKPRSRCDIREEDTLEVCYAAGDSRVNQNVVLTPLQIMFVRIHNLIATELANINPQWNDETLYQESRRIVIAIVQHITYKEFLQILVGDQILKETGMFVDLSRGLENTYDKFLNPSTVSEFMNSAYRSLHTVIVPKVQLVTRLFTPLEVDIVDWMERPQIVQNFYTQFLRGQQTQFIQKYDNLEPFNINNLFNHSTKPFGGDLEAISIQRQRDFGTPGYNEFRVYSRLPRAKTWEDLKDQMDDENIQLLRSAYVSVDDVDLFVGGLYERPVPGSLVGVTFWKLIVEQFFRWKFGDRFFYTFGGQAGSFSPAQLAEIKKVSSGWLFCAATNNIGQVHPNNMNNRLANNDKVPCSELPRLDLSKWKVRGYSKVNF